jgi:hypothetical protein
VLVLFCCKFPDGAEEYLLYYHDVLTTVDARCLKFLRRGEVWLDMPGVSHVLTEAIEALHVSVKDLEDLIPR